MPRSRVERRLDDLNRRLQALREELRIAESQLPAMADDAEEARVRSLVSDDPSAVKEHRAAARHADALTHHRSRVVARIAVLEAQQDELLDQLISEGR